MRKGDDAKTGERGRVMTGMLQCPAWTAGERRLQEGGSCLRQAAVLLGTLNALRRTHAGLREREGPSVGEEWRRAFILIDSFLGQLIRIVHFPLSLLLWNNKPP